MWDVPVFVSSYLRTSRHVSDVPALVTSGHGPLTSAEADKTHDYTSFLIQFITFDTLYTIKNMHFIRIHSN